MLSQLHCFAQSGNAYKAALMLELCGEPWEPVHVRFFEGAARTSEYAAVNEMAEVPVYSDGRVRLSQSGVILDYLSHKHRCFGAETEAERLEILRWTLWDNHKLTANIATARFMQLYLAERHRNPDVIAFLMGRARAALGVLERRLEARDWIVADRPTTADLSCAGYIWFLEEIGLEPAPATAAWRDRLAAQPGWKHPYELMPGHPFEAAE
ncbi:glutathione S-transferase [Rhodobacteraceae bacterium 2CG4]|uniref:Glutathione S-transferase n=1 Tax=Halovulum marinum TaxID=2662447 RepID=A0A6L5Z433_9RHOB|nr:glutathione S-transferase [Halovulum marinum]MSU91079.1 glutathione S-transferase [Halovulum marinum]